MNKKVEAVEEIKEVSTETSVVETKETVAPAEVKLSKEELKKKIRRGNLQFQGRLRIDDKYKTPGKVLRVVSLKPGRKEYLESLGYRARPDIQIGGDTLEQAKGTGGVFDLGINHSNPSIVMEIDQDLYDARQEVKSEDNEAIFKAKVAENQKDSMK